MSHHERIRNDPYWAIGPVWTDAEVLAMDNALTASVNGDGGGTWSPNANVVVGGAGLRLIATTHTMTGTMSAVTTNGSTALLTHGDSDYVLLAAGHAGQSRTILSPVGAARWVLGWVWEFSYLLSTVLGATARIPLEVHTGATLTSVSFTFVVDGSTSVLPAQMPAFGVFARDAFGNVIALSSVSAYQSPNPASVAAWVNGGVQQTFVFECDEIGINPFVQVDTTQYTYFAEIIEASGANAVPGTIEYADLSSSFVGIADIHPG